MILSFQINKETIPTIISILQNMILSNKKFKVYESYTSEGTTISKLLGEINSIDIYSSAQTIIDIEYIYGKELKQIIISDSYLYTYSNLTEKISFTILENESIKSYDIMKG